MKKGVILKKGKEVIFQNRHQWIFSGAIDSFPDGFENGPICPVFSFDKKLLGYAYFHRGISLSGRIVSFGESDPYQMVLNHLQEAIDFRKSLFDKKRTNAFRLVNGEGDFLPGLVIDEYNGHLVLQSNTLGMDLLKEKIVDYLVSKKEYKAIYEKSVGHSRKEEGLLDITETLFGEEVELVTVLENGYLFDVDLKKGQKTGFFLDQREMRRKVGELSFQKRVLNAFCYTGGFSVYAKGGGALKVDSLDVSAGAITLAKKNMEQNGFNDGGYFTEDALVFLDKEALDYDLVILDPPAFAKKKGDIENASKGYRKINTSALSKIPKGSLLLTCSCSYYIDETMFQTILFQAAREAYRDIQIISKHIQASCHPVSLFHPESHYLKSLLLRIV